MTKPKKNSPKLVQIVAGKPAESSQGNRHSLSSSRIGDQPLNVQHNMRRGLHFLSDPLLTRWHKNLINARHEVVELSTKISSCITFGLLTLGFKEAQQPRPEAKSKSSVGRVTFTRIDKSIMGTHIKNLYIPNIEGEGPAATLRAKLYRAGLALTQPIARRLLKPNDASDREIANTHEGLKEQWGFLSLVYPLPNVPEDLQRGAARGDRLGGIVSGSGLFSHYLIRTGEHTFMVNLEQYRAYDPMQGFERLGFRAELTFSQGEMHCERIYLGETVLVKPDINTTRWTPAWLAWNKAQDIAMATLILDAIAVQHLLRAHLINVAMIGQERNRLEVNHPIARFLDPHTIGTVGIHWSQISFLIGDHGFLSLAFPYDQKTINQMLDQGTQQFDYATYDIEADIKARKMDGDVPHNNRSQDYCLTLYREYRAGAQRYVESVYATDDDMHADQAIMELLHDWIDKVFPAGNTSIQDYLSGRRGTQLTRYDLARLLANYIFMATITHENVGNVLLQYVLQAHLMPIAVPSGNKQLSVRRFYVMASILVWTSLPKESLGSFYEATKIPESEELEAQVFAFWEYIRYLMGVQEHDPRLPGAALPGLLERSVNQ